MAVQESVAVRNAKLDAVETTIGTSPKLQLRSGAQPANCAAASSGTLLLEITLPSNWLNDAASAAKTLLGTWQGSVTTGGTAAHWRVMDSSDVTCHKQGSITVTGGGGDLELSTVTLVLGGLVTITAWTMNEANA